MGYISAADFEGKRLELLGSLTNVIFGTGLGPWTIFTTRGVGNFVVFATIGWQNGQTFPIDSIGRFVFSNQVGGENFADNFVFGTASRNPATVYVGVSSAAGNLNNQVGMIGPAQNFGFELQLWDPPAANMTGITLAAYGWQS